MFLKSSLEQWGLGWEEGIEGFYYNFSFWDVLCELKRNSVGRWIGNINLSRMVRGRKSHLQILLSLLFCLLVMWDRMKVIMHALPLPVLQLLSVLKFLISQNQGRGRGTHTTWAHNYAFHQPCFDFQSFWSNDGTAPCFMHIITDPDTMLLLSQSYLSL